MLQMSTTAIDEAGSKLGFWQGNFQSPLIGIILPEVIYGSGKNQIILVAKGNLIRDLLRIRYNSQMPYCLKCYFKKQPASQVWGSHYKGKMVMRSSHHYNEKTYASKTAFSHWNGSRLLCEKHIPNIKTMKNVHYCIRHVSYQIMQSEFCKKIVIHHSAK